MHLAFFAGVLGLGAWCGRRWEGVRPTLVLGRWGVAAVAGYIGLCLVCQTVAQYLLARTLGRRWPPSSVWQRCRCRVGPVRRGIAVTRSSYLVSHVTLVPPTVSPPDVIAKGLDTPGACPQDLSFGAPFLDRARFPVVDASEHDGTQIVRYVDLRATGDGRPRPRWGLVVRLNAAGHMQAVSSSIASFCRPLRTFNL